MLNCLLRKHFETSVYKIKNDIDYIRVNEKRFFKINATLNVTSLFSNNVL